MSQFQDVETWMKVAKQVPAIRDDNKVCFQWGLVSEEYSEGLLAQIECAINKSDTLTSEEQESLKQIKHAYLAISTLAKTMKKQKTTFAFEGVSRVDLLDSLTDMIWVILGTGVQAGFDMDGAWNEVRRSNYSKFVMGENGEMVAILDDDGKVIKGPQYSPANLEAFV